jgi:magnesium chelatase family protein
MLARRIPSILPDLSFEESLEITKIHSIAGILKAEIPIITTRPFRSPHHTISATSLTGGGIHPKPGEISLAHYGVLFLDELPEFNQHTLEVLRGPLEDGIVTISRVNGTFTYPCNFMFVASMNPCPCGYYGVVDKECTCTPQAIAKYIGKISGPLLDRIDIQIEVSSIPYEKLQQEKTSQNSEKIKNRVNRTRILQRERYAKEKIYSNSSLTPKLIQKYCKLDQESKNLLEKAFEKMNLSARAYSRILKVARTIADLEGKEQIQKYHIAEAIQYRSLDKKYWKN